MEESTNAFSLKSQPGTSGGQYVPTVNTNLQTLSERERKPAQGHFNQQTEQLLDPELTKE